VSKKKTLSLKLNPNIKLVALTLYLLDNPTRMPKQKANDVKISN
jgi:hypothetical protein